MMRLSGYALLVAAIIESGCHRSPAIDPLPTKQAYCWWVSQYVAAPPVTVASQFQGALSSAGFTNARWQRTPDSAWATAGPTALPASPAGAMYAFRAVAFPASDSIGCAWRGMPDATVIRRPVGALSFHTEVFIIGPRNGWAKVDSSAAGDRVLPLCGAIYGYALTGLEILK
ncbi:MAG: hypothetical protein ABI408_10035 [Gemmatimonadaceae bacterium]